MHRNHKFNILEFAYNRTNRSANGFNPITLILATMRRQ